MFPVTHPTYVDACARIDEALANNEADGLNQLVAALVAELGSLRDEVMELRFRMKGLEK